MVGVVAFFVSLCCSVSCGCLVAFCPLGIVLVFVVGFLLGVVGVWCRFVAWSGMVLGVVLLIGVAWELGVVLLLGVVGV